MIDCSFFHKVTNGYIGLKSYLDKIIILKKPVCNIAIYKIYIYMHFIYTVIIFASVTELLKLLEFPGCYS